MKPSKKVNTYLQNIRFHLVDFILMDLFCALIDRPSINRKIETSFTKDGPFPRVTRVTNINSFARTLLLNKKHMFPLKLPRPLGASKLLLFAM